LAHKWSNFAPPVAKTCSETDEGARGADHAQLRRVLTQLCKGGVLMVTRLDRQARSADQTTYCSIKLLRAGGSRASLALMALKRT
jgi:hypothetical protein